jgi:hypothetical protein
VPYAQSLALRRYCAVAARLGRMAASHMGSGGGVVRQGARGGMKEGSPATTGCVQSMEADGRTRTLPAVSHSACGGSSAGRLLTANAPATGPRGLPRVRRGAVSLPAHAIRPMAVRDPGRVLTAPRRAIGVISGPPPVRHGTVSLRATCQAGRRDRSDRRPGGGSTSGANTGAPALLRGSRFARVGGARLP